MTRKTHRQRRRVYERRRRTRRRQHLQKGGDGEQLTTWMLAANMLREASTGSAFPTPWDFRTLIKSELRLTPAPGGPVLPRFEPSSLGDIITNIAATFGDRIPNGQTFIAVMTKLKTEDPDVYGLLQRLEAILREEAQKVTQSGEITVLSEPVDLTSVTIEKPHFLWIAYANLQAEEPEHPVLLKELPAAPAQTTTTLVPSVPSQQVQ